MQLRPTLASINDVEFEGIYKILMEGTETRCDLFAYPEKVLTEKGIKLNAEHLDVLKSIASLTIDKDKTGFNEKLVLCSSSGY